MPLDFDDEYSLNNASLVRSMRLPPLLYGNGFRLDYSLDVFNAKLYIERGDKSIRG